MQHEKCKDVIEWSKQLCDVLGYLHSREKPIIYRDMKPSNVMLKPDGKVILIDFGTAREFKEKNIADTTCLGTQGYAAPEQFGGMGQTDARTDIYCLGATMYHLVTGHNPAEPPYEMYPITQWDSRLSSGLEEIILKCTQRNPKDRYQSCAELMYALEHYQDLDNETKKDYKKKWRLFLVSVSFCLVSFAGAVGFKMAGNSKVQSTYDYCVESGDKASAGKNYEEARESYIDAIEIAPERGDAYLGLIENAILGDEIFTTAEGTIIKEVIDNTDSGGRKYQDNLKLSDPKAYGQLMYDLGNAYYYYYDNQEVGRIRAGEYYRNAANSIKGLDENELNRAKTLAGICEYIENVGKPSKDGSSKVPYSTLWADLRNTVETDFGIDYSLAIKAYNTFVIFLQTYEDKFIGNKITYEEMLEALTFVQDKIEEIYIEYEQEDELLNEVSERELNEVRVNIDSFIGEVQKSVNRGEALTEIKEDEEKNNKNFNETSSRDE